MPLPALAARAPTKPVLSGSAASALQWATRSVFPADGPPQEVLDPGWRPPRLAPAALDQARRDLAAYEHYLAPIGPQRLGLYFAALQSHWYVPDVDNAVDEVATLQWQQALLRFPEWAVAAACQDWVDNQTKRPVPADIAGRCRWLVASAISTRDGLRRLTDPQAQAQAQARLDARRVEDERDRERRDRLAADPAWSPLSDALRRALEARPDADDCALPSGVRHE